MSDHVTTCWECWQDVTRRLYLRTFKGWPRAEMRSYFERGLTPTEALVLAGSRRKA